MGVSNIQRQVGELMRRRPDLVEAGYEAGYQRSEAEMTSRQSIGKDPAEILHDTMADSSILTSEWILSACIGIIAQQTGMESAV